MNYCNTQVASLHSSDHRVPSELTLMVDSGNVAFFVASGETTLSFTLETPAYAAGSYEIAVADLRAGPVNVVPPRIEGTPAYRRSLVYRPGIWLFEEGTVLTKSMVWSGTGATAEAPYEVRAEDAGNRITVTETVSTPDGATQTLEAHIDVPDFELPRSDDLLLWLDPEGVLDDGAGRVTRWLDYSPQDLTFVPQSTLAVIRAPDGITVNGSGGMQATMTPDSSLIGAVATHGTAALFVVAHMTYVPQFGWMGMFRESSGANQAQFAISTGNTYRSFVSGQNGVAWDMQAGAGQIVFGRPVLFEWQVSNGQLRQYVDGSVISTVAVDASGLTTNSTGAFLLGTNDWSFATKGTFKGVVLTRDLDPANLSTIRGHLAARHGISLT